MLRKITFSVAASLPVAIAAALSTAGALANEPVPTVSPPPTFSRPRVSPPYINPHLLPPQMIKFDNVPSGTVVDATYQPAVTFSAVTGAPGNGAGCIVTSPPNQHVYASADPTLANGLGAMAPLRTPFSAAWTPPAPAGNVVTPVAPPTWPSFGGNAQIKASFQTAVSWAAIGVRPGLPAQQLGANINVPYLTACDPNGKYLGQVLYPYRVGQTGFGSYQVLSYTAPSGSTIGYVIFSTQNQTQNNNPTWAEFDDLAYF